MKVKKYNLERMKMYALIVDKEEAQIITAALGLTSEADVVNFLENRGVRYNSKEEKAFSLYKELDDALWPI